MSQYFFLCYFCMCFIKSSYFIKVSFLPSTLQTVVSPAALVTRHSQRYLLLGTLILNYRNANPNGTTIFYNKALFLLYLLLFWWLGDSETVSFLSSWVQLLPWRGEIVIISKEHKSKKSMCTYNRNVRNLFVPSNR
jgi:hypothetical protein